MGGDDSPHHGQAHSGPAPLGGKERIEYLLADLFRHAAAVVSKNDGDAPGAAYNVIVNGPRRYLQLAFAVTGGLKAIDPEVQEHLFHLPGVRHGSERLLQIELYRCRVEARLQEVSDVTE